MLLARRLLPAAVVALLVLAALAPSSVPTVCYSFAMTGSSAPLPSENHLEESFSPVFLAVLHSELLCADPLPDVFARPLCSSACRGVGCLQSCRTRAPLCFGDVAPSNYSTSPSNDMVDTQERLSRALS